MGGLSPRNNTIQSEPTRTIRVMSEKRGESCPSHTAMREGSDSSAVNAVAVVRALRKHSRVSYRFASSISVASVVSMGANFLTKIHTSRNVISFKTPLCCTY